MADPDELARTATAHDSAPTTPVTPVGDSIGRYRLERVLGSGGMGVVHVAFDPDLERRVALKVLRAQTGTEAAKRLQREARAMARLSHPNVVTVHEVGSVGGRDYVAMELVEGESLAEWLRAEKRDPRAIVEAFVAAGRGLAAAHAAGIVHRDFKPHNVLRSRGGRIAVTDFGLAREANDPMASTMPIATISNTPTSLSGLTMEGSVLGTPAYMAPEQWSGGEVTPAADQFAFSVAMWEALSGHRPYQGPTVEDLKQQVAAGPQALDASKIPRRLRSVLRKGLDPHRGERWPSMNALIDALQRAQRRPWMVFAAFGAAAVAAGVLVLVLRGRAAGVACPAPAIDPVAAWGDDAPAALAAVGQGHAAKLLAADARRWKDARSAACAYEPTRRAPALACLDGVLTRFDAVARSAAAPNLQAIDVGSMLIDPVMCGSPSPPRLVATVSPAVQEVIALRLHDGAKTGPADEAAISGMAERVAADPCAEALAQLYLADVARSPQVRARAEDLADQAADRCGDDRIRADLAIGEVLHGLSSEYVATTFASKLARAEMAVQRVPQVDLSAWLADFKMVNEARNDRIDKALEQGQIAIAGFAQRGRIAEQIKVALRMLTIRQERAAPEDLAAVASELPRLRQLATSELGPSADVVHAIDQIDAGWAWMLGDVAGAHARLEALRRPEPNADARDVSGVVVDEAGRPVAGATVVAGKEFTGDSISVALPLDEAASLRSTTTTADGVFHIPDAASVGVVVAQLGDQRSYAESISSPMKLVLHPTARITGTLELRGMEPTKVLVAASPHAGSPTANYNIVSPVSRDGTFSISGAPRGKVDVAVSVRAMAGQSVSMKVVDVPGPELANLALDIPTSGHTITVYVRSTANEPLRNAQIFLFKVKLKATETLTDVSRRFGDLRGLTQHLGRPVEPGSNKPGELFAVLDAPDGVVTACALGLPADLADPAFSRAAGSKQDQIVLSCVPVPPDATELTIRANPWPRFD